MKLIVGLGNPGLQYEFTRHNIGFIILDSFADAFKIRFKEGSENWKEGKIGDKPIYLLKPMTFVNNSGLAIKDFIDKNNIDIKNILVVVDDFQLPLGTLRIRNKGGDGGHNGLSNIIYHLNSDKFPRMRVGIGKGEIIKKDEFVDFVLSNFVKEEVEVIKDLIPIYNNCIKSFITEGITKTMNNYNKSLIKSDRDILYKQSQDNKES